MTSARVWLLLTTRQEGPAEGLSPASATPTFDKDFRTDLVTGAEVGVAATGADAAVKYLTERDAEKALVRQIE